MRALLAAFAAWGLAGCVSVLPESGPPPEIYRLSIPPGEPTRADLADWIVEVPEPLAPKAFSTDRIAVSQDGVRIAYVAGARWAAPAPTLVQNLVVETFDASGAIRAATRPEDGVEARYELRLEIQSFEAAYRDGDRRPPTAEIRVRAKLVDTGDRKLVAAQSFEVSERADAMELGAIVTALDAAAGELAGALVGWAVDHGAIGQGAAPQTVDRSAVLTGAPAGGR
ncbi:MAG: ABC-type transport auxiliary lipoprotein family protein [Caulobacterales bacterium]|nr:ABC-type transport auxiliary lipoprotein family protein [Caulobacterales bacterium]